MSADPVVLTRDLIRCPSVTPAEGGALAYLETVLTQAGFRVSRVTFQESGADDVENLYARIGDSGPNLVFAGHTDVVPPATREVFREGWELEGRDAAHVDHVTDDLAGFLRKIAA